MERQTQLASLSQSGTAALREASGVGVQMPSVGPGQAVAQFNRGKRTCALSC